MKILSGKEYRRLCEKAADAARLHDEAMDLRAKLNKETLENTRLRSKLKDLTEELEKTKNAAEPERKKKLTRKASKK